MFYPTAILYKCSIPIGVKHKTISILIFSTLYKYFSEADYTKIGVQKKYSVFLWMIHWLHTSWEGLHRFINACKMLTLSIFFFLSFSHYLSPTSLSLSPTSLSLSLFLSLSLQHQLAKLYKVFTNHSLWIWIHST